MVDLLVRRRVGWPTVLLLLALLGIAVLMLHEATEGRGAGPPRPERPSLEEPVGPDTYRRYPWGPRIPGSSGGEGPDPRNLDAVYDPQTRAMEESFGRFDGGGAALPFSPAGYAARIVEREGDAIPAADAACDVRVLPVAHRQFNCLVRVRCAGHILYPNPSQTAGYVRCQLAEDRPVSVLDRGPTAVDGDPMVSIDLASGAVTVEDRGDGAFRIQLERVE